VGNIKSTYCPLLHFFYSGPNPTHQKLKNLDPTHGSTQPMDNSGWRQCRPRQGDRRVAKAAEIGVSDRPRGIFHAAKICSRYTNRQSSLRRDIIANVIFASVAFLQRIGSLSGPITAGSINQPIFRVVQVIKSLHDPLEVGNNLTGISDNVRE